MADKNNTKKDAEALDFELTAEEKAKRQQLESTHGRSCYLIKAMGLAVWFTEPTTSDVDCWMSEVAEEKGRVTATVDLIRRNFADEEGKTAIAKRPAVIVAMANVYGRAIGLAADALLGK